jgi:hypothetical protein
MRDVLLYDICPITASILVIGIVVSLLSIRVAPVVEFEQPISHACLLDGLADLAGPVIANATLCQVEYLQEWPQSNSPQLCWLPHDLHPGSNAKYLQFVQWQDSVLIVAIHCQVEF